MQRRSFLLGLPLGLAACGSGVSVMAPDDAVARAAYREPGPARLTLFTVRNVGTGSGAHTGLMINASQRVIWDPAGSFRHETIPERNDVFFGVTPQVLQFYLSFHARETYYVVIQQVDVSAEVAEQALGLALVSGPVPKAACTRATGQILQQLPGFEFIRPRLMPEKLEAQFDRVPGVIRSEYRENDSDDRFEELRNYVPEEG